MNLVEKHPMRQQIIDAILAGETLRSIAKRVVPELNHVTLSRFKLQTLAPAVQSLKGKTARHNAIKDIATAAGIRGDYDNGHDVVDQAIKHQIHGSIEKLEKRFEGWIDDAERRVVLNKDGMPVYDSAGEPVRYLEHKALAAHSRNMLSSVELRAKMAGLLQDGTPGTHINITLAMSNSPTETAQAVNVIELERTR